MIVLYAVSVSQMGGWLPTYLQIFILLCAITGSLCVVHLRAKEPMSTNWFTFSLLVAIVAAMGSLPGISMCLRAEDIPVAFLGPFISLMMGALLLAYLAVGNFHSRDGQGDGAE